MTFATHFYVNPGWEILFVHLGLDPKEVLECAGLPTDLFSQVDAVLSVEEYFQLWRSLEITSKGEDISLKIGQSISIEVFEPPLFACFCSPNLNVALNRLSQYKPLIGPLQLIVNINSDCTTARIKEYFSDKEIPHSVGQMEMVYFTQLARLATRKHITPLEVILKKEPSNKDEYESYFGIPITLGEYNQITFSAEDAFLPFVSANERMWSYFEPELIKRLSELGSEASIAEKVKSSLIEMLPLGQSSMEEVADRLAVSKRTLHRKLNDEGENFKEILKNLREQLAKHYLLNSPMTLGEISFMLGFQDSNSFNRAYTNWTGVSPGAYRKQASKNKKD